MPAWHPFANVENGCQAGTHLRALKTCVPAWHPFAEHAAARSWRWHGRRKKHPSCYIPFRRKFRSARSESDTRCWCSRSEKVGRKSELAVARASEKTPKLLYTFSEKIPVCQVRVRYPLLVFPVRKSGSQIGAGGGLGVGKNTQVVIYLFGENSGLPGQSQIPAVGVPGQKKWVANRSWRWHGRRKKHPSCYIPFRRKFRSARSAVFRSALFHEFRIKRLNRQYNQQGFR